VRKEREHGAASTGPGNSFSEPEGCANVNDFEVTSGRQITMGWI